MNIRGYTISIFNMSWLLAASLLNAVIYCGCSESTKDARTVQLDVHEIRSRTELPLVGFQEAKEFAERNPEFNPSWFAKFEINSEQAANLEGSLQTKRLLNLGRDFSPGDLFSWWNPDAGSSSFTYFTTDNAIVNVVIPNYKKHTTETQHVNVFVWWSSP